MLFAMAKMLFATTKMLFAAAKDIARHGEGYCSPL